MFSFQGAISITAFRNLVGSSGLEPPTSRLSGARSNLLSYRPVFPFPFRSSKASRGFAPSPYLTIGGDDGIRTHDPLLAGQVLSQLSYTPSVSLLPFLGPWKLNNNLSRLSCTSALSCFPISFCSMLSEDTYITSPSRFLLILSSRSP